MNQEIFHPLPNNPSFFHDPDDKSYEIVQEKENIVVTSSFFFSSHVFNHLNDDYYPVSQIKFAFSNCFGLGKGHYTI